MKLRSPAGIDTPLRTLDTVLAAHQLWLESHGSQGSRLELPQCDLRGADLRQRNLCQADLQMANFAGADLSRTKLCGARLAAANFRHAILCNANLDDFEIKAGDRPDGQSTISLSVPTVLDGADFGGADLTIAKFPRRSGFAVALEQTLRRARRARLFAAALGILLVVLLFQVGAARDVRLLLPARAASGMAVVDMLAGKFVLLGTAVLAVLAYAAWIFGPLRKLCLPQFQLPARLPDGAALDANRALWPLNLLAAHWMPLLRDDRTHWRAKIPVWMTLAALFCVPPLMSVLVWWRLLAIHEWRPSALLTAVAAAATGAACFGWLKSRQALGGPGNGRAGHEVPNLKPRPAVGAAVASLLSAAVLLGLSYGVIEGGVAPFLAARADIAFQHFSILPPNVAEASIAAIPGPNLAGRNLRYARISYSSLVSANLRNARLDHAAITVSDLRRADLTGADLREATFFASNLETARLTGADLRGATLLCVVGLDGHQLAAAQTDQATILPDGSAGPFRAGSNTLVAKADACAHWAPGNAPPVAVAVPQALLPPGGTLAPVSGTSLQPGGEAAPGEAPLPGEPDLSPIPELKPSRKPPTPTEPKR